MDLDGYTLVHYFYTGARAWVIDLTGYSTDEDGFFVIGSAAVEAADATWMADFGFASDEDALRNGNGDALGLYTDWNGAAGTAIDVVCWEGAAADRAPCEGTPSPGIANRTWHTSIGRFEDGRDSNDNSVDFLTALWATPGAPNAAPEPAGYTRISGINAIYPTFPIEIPDDDETGITARLSSAAAGPETISGVYVGVRIQHPFIGDLIVSLVSPGHSIIVLHNRTGGGSDDINAVYGLDTDPADGADALDALIGETGRGNWTLRVSDNAGGDVGGLVEWVLWIN
jgi:subtilisin-like proprotein convertase family protein